jgi:ATPase subunit of ABC transporter with duplicated ATPase domains
LSTAFLSFSHLSFAWPDGAPVLDDVSGAASSGLTAIVGANGAGKSTLLRVLAGELTPVGGHVASHGSLRYVPQDVVLDADAGVANAVVADVLGVTPTLAALRAISAGSVDPAHYDAVGDDWDVESRAEATLAGIGLPGLDLNRPVSTLSGGEATLLALASALLARPDVLLLDEPTNNLDGPAKDAVTRALLARDGATLVVTHDRHLLERVSDIGELRRHDLRWFGGNIDHYEQTLADERETAHQVLRTASAKVAKEHRELRAYVEGAAKRSKQGEKAARSMPAIVAGGKKRQAQQTLARVKGIHEDRLADAKAELDAAEDAVDEDKVIRVDLPGTRVPPRREVLTIVAATLRTGTEVNLLVQGPERIALDGRNGAGKTTLLRAVTGDVPQASGVVSAHVPVGYLPQRLDLLDDALSVVDNVRERATGATPHEVREGLARFLFRGRAGDAPAATLSGGERFRASLACLLLARPAPQLLLLDEPTNNLDFASRSALIEALGGYEGALIVVSHDADFLSRVGITRTVDVSGADIDGSQA